DPRRELYRNNLATVLIRQGEVDEAVSHLMAVHSPAVSHYNAGYLLQQNGRTDLAAEQFQLSLNADPRFEPARRWLQSLTAESPSFGSSAYGPADMADPYPSSARRRNEAPPAARYGAPTTVLPSQQATPRPARQYAPVEEVRGPTIV